jgi:eukaryotic-like serine/threonine-protein kinase
MQVGAKLGAFEVIAKLGEGGMGEVYRARDTRLGREVALKILPEAFATDAERLARFAREARTLASLNHPHIAQIHGVEENPSTGSGQTPIRALVMELVEGDDLAARIGRGAVPLDEVLSIARQIADALEGAHEHGIVHRDLKPANVKVRADGTVKVLDFGLAKAFAPGEESGVNPVASPTLTSHDTRAGMILGTAAYMSPEQARGRQVDRRADIWSFGVIVFEMLTGKPLFETDTISDTLAAVLRQEIAWESLSSETPASIRRLLRRCLERDVRRRLSAIADARLEIDDAIERRDLHDDRLSPAHGARPETDSIRQRWRLGLAGCLGGVVATAAIAAVLWPQRDVSTEVTRTTIVAPEKLELYPDPAESAISPDGRFVAFVTGDRFGSLTAQLWIRPVDSLAARPLEGASGARLPFWAPDSQRIGFFAEGKLKTVSIDGGRPNILCNAPSGRGGSWSTAGVIVFAPDASSALMRVAATGGDPVAVTTLDASRRETNHRFPWFLPDGDRFLYTVIPGRESKFDIYIGSLNGAAPELLGAMESSPVYAEPGLLLFMRQGVLTAQGFDPERRQLVGDVRLLPDSPGGLTDPSTMWTAGRVATASANGVLAYLTDPVVETRAQWVDGSGRPASDLPLPRGQYSMVRIAPDGQHAALVREVSPVEAAIVLVNLSRGTVVPLTTGRGVNSRPIWSPDSARVVFASDRDGAQDLYVKDVQSSASEQVLFRSPAAFKLPNAWSPDGKWIILQQVDSGNLQNIYLVPASGEGEPTLLVSGPGRDMTGRPSPDGKWLAYLSDETGRQEIYVQKFPEGGGRVPLTTSGAFAHWWRRDGRQIRFLDGNRTQLVAVDLATGTTVKAGEPRPIGTFPPDVVDVDAMPDLERFLVLLPTTRAASRSVTLVTNWTTALK